MTGASLTVSQVQSIPWSAAPSSTWLLLVTSAFVTPVVTGGIAAKRCAIRVTALVGVPVSIQEKELEQLAQFSVKRIGCWRTARLVMTAIMRRVAMSAIAFGVILGASGYQS
jgi:hypothetical protein